MALSSCIIWVYFLYFLKAILSLIGTFTKEIQRNPLVGMTSDEQVLAQLNRQWLAYEKYLGFEFAGAWANRSSTAEAPTHPHFYADKARKRRRAIGDEDEERMLISQPFKQARTRKYSKSQLEYQTEQIVELEELQHYHDGRSQWTVNMKLYT